MQDKRVQNILQHKMAKNGSGYGTIYESDWMKTAENGSGCGMRAD